MVRQGLSTICAALMASALLGCQARRIEQQGIDFRQGLLNIYTEQMLDNLIRAHRDEPFLQLEITEVFAQEFDEIGVTGSLGETVTDARTLLLSGTSSNTGMRSITAPWTLGGNSKRQGTLNFKAKPITNRDAVYEAYVAFAKSTETFRVTRRKPAREEYHSATLRCRKGLYYWVPADAAGAYRALFLRTTVQHEAHGPQGYYAVRIMQVEELSTGDSGSAVDSDKRKDVKVQLVVFDRKVPAGEALLVVEKDGKTVRVPLFMALDQVDVDFGDQTDRLEAEYSPGKRGIDLADYIGRNARLYSRDFPPEADKLQAIVEGVDRAVNTLDRIQALEP